MISIQYSVISPSKAVFFCHLSSISHHLKIVISHSLSIFIFHYKSIITHHQDVQLKIENKRSPLCQSQSQMRPSQDCAHLVCQCVRLNKKVFDSFTFPSTPPTFPCPIHPFVHLPKAFVGWRRLNFYSSLLVIFHLSYIH